MSHRIVRTMLEAQLTTWAKARTPALRVEYQGQPFKPSVDEVYLRAFLLPASTNSITLEGTDRVFIGVFQVSVVAPAGKGTGMAEGVSEELEQLFPNGLRLSKGALDLITLTPLEVGPAIIADTTLTIPTSFQYRAEIDSSA